MSVNAPTADLLTRLVAAAIAGQARRHLEAQNDDRPSVDTTEPAYTGEELPTKRTWRCNLILYLPPLGYHTRPRAQRQLPIQPRHHPTPVYCPEPSHQRWHPGCGCLPIIWPVTATSPAPCGTCTRPTSEIWPLILPSLTSPCPSPWTHGVYRSWTGQVFG